MHGFDPQNVLFDLEFEDLGPAGDDHYLVRLPASNGLEASFRCSSTSVLRVEDFKPGKHSVYGR